MKIEPRKTEYAEAGKLAEIQKSAFMPLYEIYNDKDNYLPRIFIAPEFQGMGIASNAIIMFEEELYDAASRLDEGIPPYTEV